MKSARERIPYNQLEAIFNDGFENGQNTITIGNNIRELYQVVKDQLLDKGILGDYIIDKKGLSDLPQPLNGLAFSIIAKNQREVRGQEEDNVSVHSDTLEVRESKNKGRYNVLETSLQTYPAPQKSAPLSTPQNNIEPEDVIRAVSGFVGIHSLTRSQRQFKQVLKAG